MERVTIDNIRYLWGDRVILDRLNKLLFAVHLAAHSIGEETIEHALPQAVYNGKLGAFLRLKMQGYLHVTQRTVLNIT